jgi:DNA-binding transcriptional LysR family regulator
MSRLSAFAWLNSVAPDAAVATRSNSLTGLLSAVKAGLGVGMLPCFVGDSEPGLVRCLPPIRELDAEVWLIVRDDVRQAPHVRAFVDSLAAHMQALRRIHAGQNPTESLDANAIVPPAR